MKTLNKLIFLVTTLLPLCSAMALPATESQRTVPAFDEVVAKYGSHEANGDAEVLYKYREITLNELNQEEITTYMAVRINREEAIPYYSQFVLHFDEYYENLNLDFARVKTQSGELHELPKSAVQVKTANNALFYNQQKQLTFSVPKLIPGAIIEFQYTRKSFKSVIENHWFHTDVLGWRQRNSNTGEYSFDTIGTSEVLISTPIGTKLYLHGQGLSTIKQKHYNKKGRNFIELSRTNIKKTILEPMMPPTWITEPRVVLTTLQNWQQVNQLSYQTFLSGLDKNDQSEINKLASEITRLAPSPEQKLHAIFTYVQQNIRYVYAHLGRGGLTPHSSSWTLKNGFGDCKDQSALLTALLNAVGIKAYPALYNTSELYVLKQAPRLMFDHMIVYLPKQTGIAARFIDTSNYKLQFPGISAKNNAAQAFVLGEGKGEFVHINQQEVTNSLEITTDYQSIDADKITAEITLSAKGYYDNYFRSIWLQSQEKEQAIKDIIKSLTGSGTINGLTVKNEKDLFKSVVITAKLEFPMNGKLSDGLLFGASYQQVARTFLPMDVLQSKEKRQQGLFNTLSMNITYTTKVTAKMDLYANLVEQPRDIETKHLKMTSETLSGEKMAVQMNLSIKPFTLALADIKNITTPFNDAIENGSWLIQVKPGKLNSTTSLDTDTEGLGVQGIKNLIDRGEYQQALTNIEKLLIKQEDAEGYFLKGLVLGFLSKHTDSDIAFDKAELLGYDI
jgi:hypothetical protein